MPNWLNYKGILVPNPTPGDAAGVNLKSALMTLADRAGAGLVSSACIFLTDSGDLATNQANLAAAYTAAQALTPNGSALAAGNRAAVVFLGPGVYPTVAEWNFTAEFVDFIGVGDRTDIVLLSGDTTTGYGFKQTANDIVLENFTMRYEWLGAPLCVFAMDSNGHGAEIHANLRFVSINGPNIYATRDIGGNGFNGTYDDVRTTLPFLYNGNCGGSFIDCDGGPSSFAFELVASGTFVNCSGALYGCFGAQGTASGTFVNCGCPANSFGVGGVASGSFTNCNCGGGSGFGGTGGTASGIFTNCIGGVVSFGGDGGIASGTFTNCTVLYQGFSFPWGGTVTGSMFGCSWNLSDGYLLVGSGATIDHCRIVGSNSGSPSGGVIDAASPGTSATITLTTALQGIGTNITNTSTTPYNVTS